MVDWNEIKTIRARSGPLLHAETVAMGNPTPTVIGSAYCTSLGDDDARAKSPGNVI